MKNIDKWKPTKFIFKGGNLIANDKHVGRSSLIMASLIAKSLQKSITANASGDLLDLGCGTVPLYEVYKDKVSSVTCADWQNSLHENIHLDVNQDLTQPLKFEDANFDTVVMSDVLEHIPYPLDLLNEINRVLRKNGKLIMSTPFAYWEHEEPYDFNRYTQYMYERMAADAGYEVVEISPVGDGMVVAYDSFIKSIGRCVKGRLKTYTFKAIALVFEQFIKHKMKNDDFAKDNKQPVAYTVVLKKVK